MDLAWLLPALFPEARLARVALDLWLAYFHLQVPDRHRADVDALMTAELMLIAMKRARHKGIDDFKSLADLAQGQAMLHHANGTGGI
jgi:DNA polymerase-3 subunit epsilon